LILIRDWLPVLLWMAAIFWGSSRSTLPGPWGSREPWSNALGMATHMAEYALLAALAYRALRKTSASHASAPSIVHPAPDGTCHLSPSAPRQMALSILNSSFLILYSLCLTLLYTLTDEWHQTFVPGRQFDLRDLALDAAGSALALLAISSASQSRTVRGLAQRIATRVERRDG